MNRQKIILDILAKWAAMQPDARARVAGFVGCMATNRAAEPLSPAPSPVDPNRAPISRAAIILE